MYAEGKHAEAQVTWQTSHHIANELWPAQPTVGLLHPQIHISKLARAPLQGLLASCCSNGVARLLHVSQFDSSLYTQAKYSEALDAAPPAAPQRAVYFANRAAAALKLQQVSGGTPVAQCRPVLRVLDHLVNVTHAAAGRVMSMSQTAMRRCLLRKASPLCDMLRHTDLVVLQWSDAAVDCTSALAIDAGYVKAYMRRASAYEQSDDLERALADYKKVHGTCGVVWSDQGLYSC